MSVPKSQKIQTKPKPYCPECGSPMKLRRPEPYQYWSAYWTCTDFPLCRGKRGITPDGKPEYGDNEIGAKSNG